MTDNQDEIKYLTEQLKLLIGKQGQFAKEINELKIKINRLNSPITEQVEEIKIFDSSDVREEIEINDLEETFQSKPNQPIIDLPKASPQPTEKQKRSAPKVKTDLEKFIGENLINKVGIAITIIGVGIGAKYSIDNDLISPLTRIILGYLMGLGLLGFGIKLKSKYENFSAVLVSGAMAIMYFMTFFAFSLYQLIPQTLSFALMVVFTVFTVIASIFYKNQIIALVGLIGAYAVPFLLGGPEGNVVVLFTYMSIINIGILFITFKKNWKAVYYVAFGLTWLIFLQWFVLGYKYGKDFGIALTFAYIFFGIFYIMFLSYKLIRLEEYKIEDIVLLLINSFIFYGVGYALISDHSSYGHLIGLFTLGNAIIHFVVSGVIYRQKLANKNLFYLISGLVLVFITITIPVQLDDNWVPLLWAGEAAILFWIGRTKNVRIYEIISYVVMLLAFTSLLSYWTWSYSNYYATPKDYSLPLLNINFLTSLFFITAFGYIVYENKTNKKNAAFRPNQAISKIISFVLPGILIFTIYSAFRLEISNYFNQLLSKSAINIIPEDGLGSRTYRNYSLKDFKNLWIINYSFLFFSLLSVFNFKVIKNKKLGLINIGLILVTLLFFITSGQWSLGGLRDDYLSKDLSTYFHRSSIYIWIRYVSFAFVGLGFYALHKYLRQYVKGDTTIIFELLLLVTVIWITSHELINWMDIAQSKQTYKLGLSILWGVISVLLICIGIWKQKKHLRVAAIVIFAITLIKLFFYDTTQLDTISKTILFVSLGILLLIISFLYNKYKHLISDESSS